MKRQAVRGKVFIGAALAVVALGASAQTDAPQFAVSPRTVAPGEALTITATGCTSGGNVEPVIGVFIHRLAGHESTMVVLDRWPPPPNPEMFEWTFSVPSTWHAGPYVFDFVCSYDDVAVPYEEVVVTVVGAELENAFGDDDGHQFELALNTSHAWGYYGSCTGTTRTLMCPEVDVSTNALACVPQLPGMACPDDPITRHAVAEILFRFGRVVEGDPHTRQVPNGNRFFDDATGERGRYANYLGSQDISNGCLDGREFCGWQDATRGQVASMVQRLMGYEPVLAVDHFIDSAGVHEGAIGALASRGIVRGCSGQYFCTNAPISRAQLVEILRRTLELEGMGQ